MNNELVVDLFRARSLGGWSEVFLVITDRPLVVSADFAANRQGYHFGLNIFLFDLMWFLGVVQFNSSPLPQTQPLSQMVW